MDYWGQEVDYSGHGSVRPEGREVYDLGHGSGWLMARSGRPKLWEVDDSGREPKAEMCQWVMRISYFPIRPWSRSILILLIIQFSAISIFVTCISCHIILHWSLYSAVALLVISDLSLLLQLFIIWGNLQYKLFTVDAGKSRCLVSHCCFKQTIRVLALST